MRTPVLKRPPAKGLAAVIVLGLLASLGIVVATNADAGAGSHGRVPNINKALKQLLADPRYAHSTLYVQVADRATGKVLFDHNADGMSTTGSILKVYSTSTALHSYGEDHTFHTPVFRTGPVQGGAVQGDLVLVASGDFSMGLRELGPGKVAYADAPHVDHTYANTGLPAIEVGNDPLSALDELAEQVKASGITAVSGNVVIDDRLFTPFFGWPDVAVSPASPIMINDNRIDIESTPTTPDQLAKVDYRPKTSAFTVDTQVKTVPAGQAWDIQVTQPAPDKFLVTGTIAADAGKVLRVGEIPDPASFARSAFIDALQRAGVTVTAPATGPNPTGTLPAEGSYPTDQRVAEHVSGTLADFVKVILKTSHNPGADLMACLDAVAANPPSKNCEDGLVAEQQYVSGELGVDPDSFMIFDGAGSDDRDRSAPTAMDTFHRSIDQQPYADAYQDALPVLGEDGGGDLADLGRGTGAAGHVFAKTGTRAGVTPAGIGLLGARTMTGYIDARSGRHLVFTIMIRDVPFRTLDDILAIIHDAANLSISIWQSY